MPATPSAPPTAQSPSAGPAGPSAPHPLFTDHYTDPDQKRQWLKSIFDDTAQDYDRVESWLALGSGKWYRRQALLRAGLRQGMSVCDVACGTGLVAREALKIVDSSGSVLGVDPSPGMLKHATDALPNLKSAPGRAESIPAPDNSFDFLSMGYALRHVEDLALAFTEYRRVLKPNGLLCILEITSPDSRAGRLLMKTYMRLISSVFCRLPRSLGGSRSKRTTDLWRYYWDTIDRCVRPEKVLDAMKAAGFSDVKRGVQLGMFSEYTGKK